MDGQDLFVPAPTGQQGEQQAHYAPKSAVPRSTRTVLLGLPRSCLTPSRIDELSECAGNMNRLLHVLLTWPVRVDPQLGPTLSAKGPERGPPQSAFLPDLGGQCAACGYTRRECLQTGLWKQPGRSSSGRGPVLPRGPTGQRQNPARPLALASLAQTFLASRDSATRRGWVPEVFADIPGPL